MESSLKLKFPSWEFQLVKKPWVHNGFILVQNQPCYPTVAPGSGHLCGINLMAHQLFVMQVLGLRQPNPAVHRGGQKGNVRVWFNYSTVKVCFTIRPDKPRNPFFCLFTMDGV